VIEQVDQETLAGVLPGAHRAEASQSPLSVIAILNGVQDWPWSARIFAVLLVVIYLPVLQTTAGRWLTTEQYTHGVFIFPISALILYVKRHEISAAARCPNAAGILVLSFGLLIQVVSHYLNFEFFSTLSLLPVIAGAVLLLHGAELWRVVRFPILFLGFAANLPGSVLGAPSRWIQSLSATGGAATMKFIGFTIMQHGNLLDVPGMTLEVADVCSGFRKLTALVVFAVLYGYLYPIDNVRRGMLIAAVVPIAIVVNTVRLCALIAAASLGGPKAEAFLHNPAEFAVLIAAFLLTVQTGKILGCTEPRFSLFSHSS
jgi:exosortase